MSEVAQHTYGSHEKKLIDLAPLLSSQRKTNIRKAVTNTGLQHVLVYNILDYFLFKELFGSQIIDLIERTFADTMREKLQESEDTSGIQGFFLDQGEYVLIWPQDEGRDQCVTNRAFILKSFLQQALEKAVIKNTGQRIRLGVGHALFREKGSGMREQIFFQAVNEARLMAKQDLDPDKLAISAEFKAILRDASVTSVYQPIVDFKNGHAMGWEALTRGPRDSSLTSPVALFDAAENLGMLFALEKICREKAIHSFGDVPPDRKLFLNIHPRTVMDPQFTPGNTLETLKTSGLTPDNIVFEITERHCIKDFDLFHKTLDHYRSQGFQVAVDDAGTGYSSLHTIAELRPDFIKMDMSLVRGIHANPVKRAIMETTVAFAEKIGTKIVAEGIETIQEASCVMGMGVHLGQGFFFGRPCPVKQHDLPNLAQLSVKSKRPFRLSFSMPVGELVEPAVAVNRDTEVKEVREHFQGQNPMSSVVACEDQRPVGLVMSYHLDKRLATRYGMALYSGRPVSHVMDDANLVVDESTPIEQAAKQAMARDKTRAYDDLVVTCGGNLMGVVSVQHLMDTLAHLQVEVAKGVNPLTGHPGNVALEQEVESRVQAQEEFNIIYADLDHFKVYNDTYGFKNGDMVIKLTARILSWAVRKYGSSESELYHIGGDDFVLVTNPGSSERMCKAVTRCFSRLIRSYYSHEDSANGWIRAKGRDGMVKDFPLISISLGVIFIKDQCSLLDIGERAAHIKKYAKSIPGNSYVHDRRLPLGLKKSDL